ncbi:MAG: hypothetical protein M3Y87_03480 [Myxococcota bacterium]|nr:hypothetical protein [Myxococcota bacterium]
MSARSLALASLLAALGVGCSCSNARPNTQVMVTIDADPGVRAVARELLVNVYGAAGGDPGVPLTPVFQRPFVVPSTDDWPFVVALAPFERDPSRRYRVEAIAVDTSGAHVATVRAISGYVQGQTLSLELRLLDRCIGVTCEDPGQTCIGPDMCDDAMIDETTLPPWGQADGGVDLDGSIGTDGGIDGCGDCDDGLACTEDFCTTEGTCEHTRDDTVCDDSNPCTDDACGGTVVDAMGCARVPNADDCDDGSFCNGLDRCEGGSCVPAGDPCVAPTVCDEASDRCLGCTSDAMCPADMEGAFTACAYPTTCATSGMQSRNVRTFACVDTACVPMDTAQTRGCMRVTNGVSCGTTSYGAWTCGGFTSVCDSTGTATRMRTELACASGACGSTTATEVGAACSRGTDGEFCDDGIACTDMEMCLGGVCQGGISECDGGGFDAGRDAGYDAGRDAGYDAGWDSGGVVTSDGGGWPCEGDPSLCSDGDPCTSDSCDPFAPGSDANGCFHLLDGSCFGDGGA